VLLAAVALLAACDDTIPAYGAVYAYAQPPENSPAPEAMRVTVSASIMSGPPLYGEPVGDCFLTTVSGRFVDAGTMRVRYGDTEVVLEDRYDGVTIEGQPLDPGMEVRVDSDGAETAPLEGSTEFPEHLGGVVMPERGEIVLLTDDLRVAWAPSTRAPPPGSERVITLSTWDDGTGIGCRADDEDGEIVISRDLLRRLYPGRHPLVLFRHNRTIIGAEEVYLLAFSFWYTEPEYAEYPTAAAWNGEER
jgi:hypothetical protein